MDTEYDYFFKFLLIGDYGVGKSRLIQRFVEETQTETEATDYKNKILKINGKRIKLQIWDTAGQERFRTITSSFYKVAEDGILIVYDITDNKTFESVNHWQNEVTRHACSDGNKYFVANKSDLSEDRAIEFTAGKEFADSLGISFFETSAKSGSNVQEMFSAMVTETLRKMEIPKVNRTFSHEEDSDVVIDFCVYIS